MNSAALGTLVLLSFLATDVEFTLHPSESQLAVLPGEHAAVTLYVEGASNQTGIELTPEAVEWHADNDGVISYVDAGGATNSASAWLSTSPRVVNVKPGGMERIIVTVKVPRTAAPGIYRAGVYIASHHEPGSSMRSSAVFRLTIRVLPSASIPEWKVAP